MEIASIVLSILALAISAISAGLSARANQIACKSLKVGEDSLQHAKDHDVLVNWSNLKNYR